MRVLITGVTGMTGSHLAEYILATHPDVMLFGMCRWRSRMDNLADLSAQGKLNTRPLEGRAMTPEMLAEHSEPDRLNLVYGELNDFLAMYTMIAAVRPDRIFPPGSPKFRPCFVERADRAVAVNGPVGW
jgi:GDP-D-mannose dehydratase